MAAMGVDWVTLVDFDTVEEVNLGPQGWKPGQVGMSKVRALAEDMASLNPGATVSAVCDRFGRDLVEADSVWFLCVDKIEVRRLIVEAVWPGALFVVDGRMAGESGQVLSIWDRESRDRYGETLFAVGEATPGRCTQQSTIYCANILAGLMVSQYTQWLRGSVLDDGVEVNLMVNTVGPMEREVQDELA